jgi:hypothetical protein
MHSHDPDTPSASVPSGGPSGPPSGEPSSGPDSIPPRRLWSLALIAGIGAGVVSWLGGEAIHGTFAPTPSYELLVSGRLDRLDAQAEVKGATLAFGGLGVLLGLFLGLAGGLARRAPRAALLAAVVGAASGLVAAVVSSLVMVPIFHRLGTDRLAANLALPLMLHGGIWSAIGAAGGLAFGVGLGGRGRAVRALLGGLLGAFGGTMIYELIGGLAFPFAEADRPVSATWGTRLIARLAVAFLAAVGAAIAAQDPKSKRSSTTPELA